MENLSDILNRISDNRLESNRASHRLENQPPSSSTAYEDGDVCQICGDRGWFTPEVAFGHPDFGQVITCQCQRKRLSDERLSRLFRYSNLGNLRRFTFNALEPKGLTDDADSQEMFAEASRVATSYADNPSGWLTFVGPNGSGKTHLAAAIANQCIHHGQVVLFMHVPDLLDHLRSTYAPTSETSYSELYVQVVEVPLLILDGLGAHSATPWAQEKLQQIINHRFNSELPTIVTTATDLSSLDPYIRSRLEAKEFGRIVQTRRYMHRQVHHLGQIEPELRRRMTIETFDVRGNNLRAGEQGSLQDALVAATKYANSPTGWLTLSGTTGVGKTHLAIAIANTRLEKGDSVFFVRVPELLDYLRGSFEFDNVYRFSSIFDEVKTASVLILDNLGGELSRPWNQTVLAQILEHRHDNRLPTVITSRTDFTRQPRRLSPLQRRKLSEELGMPAQLLEAETMIFHGPTISRIRDAGVGQLIRIDAPDYRIRQQR